MQSPINLFVLTLVVAQTIGDLTHDVPQNIGADVEHLIAVLELVQPHTLKTSEEPSQTTRPSLVFKPSTE